MVRYVARDRNFFIIVVELVLKIPCHGIFGVNSQKLRFWDWALGDLIVHLQP
jgi:hypothetical protein